MRLQKQLSRKVGNKIYNKWIVVIPPKKIKKSGLKEGDYLEIKIKKGKIILEKK